MEIKDNLVLALMCFLVALVLMFVVQKHVTQDNIRLFEILFFIAMGLGGLNFGIAVAKMMKS